MCDLFQFCRNECNHSQADNYLLECKSHMVNKHLFQLDCLKIGDRPILIDCRYVLNTVQFMYNTIYLLLLPLSSLFTEKCTGS